MAPHFNPPRPLAGLCCILGCGCSNTGERPHLKVKAKFNCLILEDDPCCSRVVEEAIREEGGTSVVCETLESARQAVAQDHFDLAVLDYHLPDGMGSDFFYFLVERRELTLSI